MLQTIADEPPVGLTGSGLLSLVYELRRIDVIEPNGRLVNEVPQLNVDIAYNQHGKLVPLTSDGRMGLSQWDVRELQKAKGAIRAAIDILMNQLNLTPADLKHVLLTGSFGGQVDIDAVLSLGMIPPVEREVVETIPNGAGFGAAMFLSDDGFAFGERLAARAEQVDLDAAPDFNYRYINAMRLTPDGG